MSVADDRPLLTIAAAARRAGCSPSSWYALARSGRLPVPFVEVGGRHLVRAADLDRWLAGSSEPVADMVAVLIRLVTVLERLERGCQYIAIEKGLQER